jgi:acyl carrier protein
VGLTLDDASGTLDRTDPAAVFAALVATDDTATEFYAYDAWGRLAARTDFNGDTTTYTYHLNTDYVHEEIADPSHPSLTFAHAPAKYAYTYDAAGNRVGAEVRSGPLHGEEVLYGETWTYDARGRPTGRSTSFGDLGYAYDAASNLTAIWSSHTDGVWLSYTYDELNRLRTVDDHRSAAPTSYTYNANGSLEIVTYGNGVQHAYAYDALNRLRFLQLTRGGSPLHGYEYRLKVSGHRERILESTGRASVYGYDGLHRMVTEQITGDPAGQNGLISYGLDAVGNRANRLSTVGLLAAQNFTYNARNHLQGDTYDANGNTVQASAWGNKLRMCFHRSKLMFRRNEKKVMAWARTHYPDDSLCAAAVTAELLTRILNVSTDSLTKNTKLLEELGMDDLEPLELVMALEESYEVEIESECASKWVTVDDLVRFVAVLEGENRSDSVP